jgi:hypothetical protein
MSFFVIIMPGSSLMSSMKHFIFEQKKLVIMMKVEKLIKPKLPVNELSSGSYKDSLAAFLR